MLQRTNQYITYAVVAIMTKEFSLKSLNINKLPQKH